MKDIWEEIKEEFERLSSIEGPQKLSYVFKHLQTGKINFLSKYVPEQERPTRAIIEHSFGIPIKSNYSLNEFFATFTDEFCENYLTCIRYASGVISCPFCGKSNPYQTNRGWKCSLSSCGKKFTIRTNTLFEGSQIKLSTWFYLIYQMVAFKKNTSSVQTSKNIGLTQGATWTAQISLRKCLSQPHIKFFGTVEVDESFISKGDWQRWGSSYVRKTPVLGLIERETNRIILKSMMKRTKEFVIPIIREHVEPGSTIYTDGFRAYRNMHEYDHDFVNHSESEWVRGKVHTNKIENVWSFFKRNIRNSHHSISNKHLQSYLDECVFKWNNRGKTQMELFDLVLKNCIYG